MREECEGIIQKEKDANSSLRDEQRKTMEALSQMKEQSVMARLKETEAMQTIADLKQKIAELELKVAFCSLWCVLINLMFSFRRPKSGRIPSCAAVPSAIWTKTLSVYDSLLLSVVFANFQPYRFRFRARVRSRL